MSNCPRCQMVLGSFHMGPEFNHSKIREDVLGSQFPIWVYLALRICFSSLRMVDWCIGFSERSKCRVQIWQGCTSWFNQEAIKKRSEKDTHSCVWALFSLEDLVNLLILSFGGGYIVCEYILNILWIYRLVVGDHGSAAELVTFPSKLEATHSWEIHQ